MLACPTKKNSLKKLTKKYQEAIIELIPREVTCIEKRGGKKDVRRNLPSFNICNSFIDKATFLEFELVYACLFLFFLYLYLLR